MRRPQNSLTIETHGEALPQATIRPRLTRRLLRTAYAPLRPLLRPLAWRARSFLLQDIRADLARLDAQLQALAARPPVVIHPTPPAPDLAALQAELAQFGKMLESTLLTVALDGEAARHPR